MKKLKNYDKNKVAIMPILIFSLFAIIMCIFGMGEKNVELEKQLAEKEEMVEGPEQDPSKTLARPEQNISSMSVEEQIRHYAGEANFQHTDYLVKLAICESVLDPNAVNTFGNTPRGSRDRGLYGINDHWHSEVPDEDAFNIETSTKWTMDMINNGQQHQWSCDQIVKGVPLDQLKRNKGIDS